MKLAVYLVLVARSGWDKLLNCKVVCFVLNLFPPVSGGQGRWRMAYQDPTNPTTLGVPGYKNNNRIRKDRGCFLIMGISLVLFFMMIFMFVWYFILGE